MSKKTPNPFGKKGKQDHQDKIKELRDKIRQNGLLAQTETPIDLPSGKQRFADVTAANKDTGELEEIHQVGRTNKNGSAVKRERDAIQDIEEATGVRVTFHPLKTIALLVAVSVVVWYIFV